MHKGDWWRLYKWNKIDKSVCASPSPIQWRGLERREGRHLEKFKNGTLLGSVQK